MASQTVANLTNILKQVYTADQLEKQFYSETPVWDRLQRTDQYTIGREAVIPLQSSLQGSETTLSAAGGALNAADPNNVQVAKYTLAYLARQISIEIGAVNQSMGGPDKSVVQAKALEIDSAILALQKSASRQFLSDGSAFIAKCGTTTASTTVVLNTSGTDLSDASGALVRGWLRKGMTVSISTSANPDVDVSNGTGVVIQSVTKSATNPTITINGSGVTTTSSNFVKVTNARTGTTAINESTGFLAGFGSSSAVVGGLDPATETYWQPATVDSSTTSMTVDLPLSLQQAVYQETGHFPTQVLTSIKQLTNLYKLLQNQQRFAGDQTASGNVLGFQWSGMNIEALPEVHDRVFYMYNPDDLAIVTGGISKPTWASDLQGTNNGMVWNIGNTNFVDGLFYPCGLAFKQRRLPPPRLA